MINKAVSTFLFILTFALSSLWGQEGIDSSQEVSYVDAEVDMVHPENRNDRGEKRDSSTFNYPSLLPALTLRVQAQEELILEQKQVIEAQNQKIEGLTQELVGLKNELGMMGRENRSMQKEIDMLSQIAKKLMTLTSQLQSLHAEEEDQGN